MKENFEIEKELKFKSNVAEITSISLEEKHDIKEGKMVGEFIVSGDYRIHEISLNKEKFNFKIPYEVDIKSDIDLNTLELEITNFIYDLDSSLMYVTINYLVSGDRKDILLFDDEENLEDFLKSREVEIIMDDVIDEIDEVLIKEDEVDVVEKEKDEEIEVIKELDEIIEENKENCVMTKEDNANDRNIDESKEKLLNSVKVEDDTYITYKIHIVKENDSLESILVKYNMSLDELKEYNEFDILKLGDKLIIPIENER